MAINLVAPFPLTPCYGGRLWTLFLCMPLDSVDTFGGTIITEWYAHPDDPTKRIKIAIFILDQELRADAVKVQTYLQQRPEGMFECARYWP